MSSLDDTLLMAYVDGELDAEEAARVEDQLARDPDAREKVRALTSLNGMLTAAYAEALHDPVPESMTRAAGEAAEEDRRPSRPPRRLPRLAVAAAIPLLVALGGALGVLWQPYGLGGGGGAGADGGAGSDPAMAASFLDEKRQQALETHLSGDALKWNAAAPIGSGTITPLKTYRADGGFCREYRETINTADGARTTIGLACREGGTWRVRYELKPGEQT